MNFTLSEIKFLGRYFENDNRLSFFNNIDVELKGDEESLLIGKGVLKEGKLEENLNSIMRVIADPEKCARLVLRTPFFVVEKYTYRTGDRLVGLENRLGEVAVGSLESTEGIMAELIHFIGISDIRNVGIDVVLDKDETLVFLNLIDLCRKQALDSFWGEKEEKEEMSMEDIQNMMESLLPNSFLKMMVNNYNYQIPSRNRIPSLMESLKNKEVVAEVKSSQVYRLKGQYALLGKTFLVPQSVTVLEMVINDAREGLISSGCLLVSAGLYDNMLFMFDEDSIRISTITCRMMLDIIENVMQL